MSARPIIRNPQNKEVTDAFGEFHTDIIDMTRGVKLFIIFLGITSFGYFARNAILSYFTSFTSKFLVVRSNFTKR